MALSESGVHDVVGLDVATSLVLGPGTRQHWILHDAVHGAARPRRGKADVVAVHRRSAAVEALVFRVTDKPQSRVFPIRDVRQGATQVRGVAGQNDHLAVREFERRDAAPGRIVNPGHHFLDVIGTELRLIRQLLERIVVPEFHLDAAIQRPSLHSLVGGNRT